MGSNSSSDSNNSNSNSNSNNDSDSSQSRAHITDDFKQFILKEENTGFFLTLPILITTAIIITVLLIYFLVPQDLTGTLDLNQPGVSDEEFTFLDRIENTQLQWLGVVVILITLATIWKSFEKNINYAIFFLIVAWISLLVVNLDYLQSRREARRLGFSVTWRTDFLFFVILSIFIAVSFSLYDIIKENYFTG